MKRYLLRATATIDLIYTTYAESAGEAWEIANSLDEDDWQGRDERFTCLTVDSEVEVIGDYPEPLGMREAEAIIADHETLYGYWEPMPGHPTKEWHAAVTAGETMNSYRDWVFNRLTSGGYL